MYIPMAIFLFCALGSCSGEEEEEQLYQKHQSKGGKDETFLANYEKSEICDGGKNEMEIARPPPPSLSFSRSRNSMESGLRPFLLKVPNGHLIKIACRIFVVRVHFIQVNEQKTFNSKISICLESEALEQK